MDLQKNAKIHSYTFLLDMMWPINVCHGSVNHSVGTAMLLSINAEKLIYIVCWLDGQAWPGIL